MRTRVYEGLDVDSDLGGQFPWKSKVIDLEQEVHQAVVDEGKANAPLTFVLLHGNPTWGFLWRKFIKPLSKHYRVVVPDHVGFGRSTKVHNPSYYTLEQHIRNLETTLAKLKVQNAVPVVQDWGGPIGMGWATRNPELVAGAVVLNTWAFVREGGMRLPKFFKFLALSNWGRNRMVNKNFFVEGFLRKMGTHRKLSEEEMNGYRAAHPEPGDRQGIAEFPFMIPQTGEMAHPSYSTMAEIEDGLDALKDVPALVVWALKDQAFRKAQLERWKTVFRNIDGPHLLPKAKHYLQEDAPDEIVGHILKWAESMA